MHETSLPWALILMARQYCRLHHGAGTRLLDDGATEKVIHTPTKNGSQL